MLRKHRFILALAAVLLVAGSATAAKIEIEDPVGDDYGPGTYVYPTDAVYTPGSFDIKDFVLETKGDKAEIDVTIAGNLDDPWRMGTGFSVQMVFVFIDNAPGGHTDSPPGLNVKFNPDTAWDKCVILSPQPKARVQQEIDAKAGDMAKDLIAPNGVRGRRSTISATVPLSELGGNGDPTTWRYEVFMQSNEGFPAEGDLLTRKVNEFEGQHRFGGGTDYDCDPHVMDILGDPDQLKDYACNDDGSTKKQATVTMVKP